MNKDLEKSEQSTSKKDQFLKKIQEDHPDWKEGDILLNKNNELYKLGKTTSKGTKVFEWRRYYTKDATPDWKERVETLEYLEKEYDYHFIKIDITDPSQFEDFCNKMIVESSKVLNTFTKDEISSETALTTRNTDKNFYLTTMRTLKQKEDRMLVMRRVLESRISIVKKQVDVFRKQIGIVMRVLETIELYLGIKEEIFQLQEGPIADVTTKVSFRQRLLYMDEEVLVSESDNPSYEGLDFKEIDKFDKWLVTNRHYDRIIPEQKGIVILRVRREDKVYDKDNFFVNVQLNEPNHKTYLLIRNGENLYRIWADINIYPRLFPLKSELQKLFDLISGQHEDSWYAKEHAQDDLFRYKQHIVLLQGLLERTQMFQPLPYQVNLLDPRSYDEETGFVNFIYDDEDDRLLADGRMRFWQWHKKLNDMIERGTRIYWLENWEYKIEERIDYQYRRSIYNRPGAGVYSIEGFDKGSKERWYFKYNPGGDVYTYDWRRGHNYHERKNSIHFYIWKDDRFVLNYDQISLEDVEFYIFSGLDRREYATMLPTLIWIRRERKKELKWEKGFVESLKIEFPSVSENFIWKVIGWWKTKVIWKRPIMKDDSKALRMVRAKIKKYINWYTNDSVRITSIQEEIEKYNKRNEKLNKKQTEKKKGE